VEQTTHEDGDPEEIRIETIVTKINLKRETDLTTWVEITSKGDKQFGNCCEQASDVHNKY
tara:strand:+ start:692 stop:871 length:180 start_codon:yes stop_codon:yes gene_type:complete